MRISYLILMKVIFASLDKSEQLDPRRLEKRLKHASYDILR